MKSLPNGYKLRADGLYQRECVFGCLRKGKWDAISRETLIRDIHGTLIRVDRHKPKSYEN